MTAGGARSTTAPHCPPLSPPSRPRRTPPRPPSGRAPGLARDPNPKPNPTLTLTLPLTRTWCAPSAPRRGRTLEALVPGASSRTVTVGMRAPRRGRRRWPRAGPRSRLARGRAARAAGARATGAAAGGDEPAEAEARAGWLVAPRAAEARLTFTYLLTREPGPVGLARYPPVHTVSVVFC